MADPYRRGYSFSGFQSNSPQTPLPGQKLDIELDNISSSIRLIETYVAAIQGSSYGPLPIMRHEGLQALIATTIGVINLYDAYADWLPPAEKDLKNVRFTAPFWPVGGAVWTDIAAALEAAQTGLGSAARINALQVLALTYRSVL